MDSKPARFQHPDLFDEDRPIVEYVLESLIGENQLERLIGKGKFVIDWVDKVQAVSDLVSRRVADCAPEMSVAPPVLQNISPVRIETLRKEPGRLLSYATTEIENRIPTAERLPSDRFIGS